MLIEGAGFTCQLSPARWKLSEEAHRWNLRWKELECVDFLVENTEDVDDQDSPSEDLQPDAGDQFASPEGPAHHPHPLVRRLSDFLLRSIDGFQHNKLYCEQVMQNQPLLTMIDAISTASTRLAMTMARASRSWGRSEHDGIIQDLTRTRWSLAEAMENAGLANHMGSANPDWLTIMRRECAELRREIRILTHEFEDASSPSLPSLAPSPVEADPPSS